MKKKFVNREKELAFLNKEFQQYESSFVIIYGRRRIGKTALIKKFIENKTAVYFLASEEMESENIPKIPIKWIHHGMLVATSHEDGLPSVCPIWKDKLPYKSVTIVCEPSIEEEVIYWLEYVHGGGSVSRRKKLDNGKIALRSNYQCW